MNVKVPFFVPTADNKEFNFLYSVNKWNCCDAPSGVCFFTTTIGLAHGDMLLLMILASSKFLISGFKKSWCLRAKGYGWAAIGAAVGFVAICILMKSVWPISLLLFDIIALYFQSTLYSSILVSSKIFASLSGYCLCIWTVLGIKIEVFGTDFELLEVLHCSYEVLSDCVHCASTWWELMAYVTSLTTNSLRGSLVLLIGFISPRCQFLGKTISSEFGTDNCT